MDSLHQTLATAAEFLRNGTPIHPGSDVAKALLAHRLTPGIMNKMLREFKTYVEDVPAESVRHQNHLDAVMKRIDYALNKSEGKE